MDAQLRPIRDLLVDKKLPYCAGVLPVSADELVLYYGKEKDGSRIDFLHATSSDLQRLSAACEPATFGLDQKDVLDETYRKAGKLDSAHFATKLDVDSANSALVDAVRFGLLEGSQCLSPIRAELYKLNVYGKDSFFKAHKDTPRLSRMFGSLVVILPTEHEGGALLLRQGGDEWSFDSAKAVSKHTPEEPHVAFIAFYGDIEHEVTTVTSGYRVTITYNLYFCEEMSAMSKNTSPPVEDMLSASFRALLADPSFMPNGGHLGFGLRYEYPTQRKSSRECIVSYLNGSLKGLDAAIYNVCSRLDLLPDLKLVYEFDDFAVMLLDSEPDLNEACYDDAEDLYAELVERHGAEIVKRLNTEYDKYYQREYNVDYEVTWVTDVKHYNRVETSFVTYGNEPMGNWAYGRFCIIVEILPAAERLADEEEAQSEGEDSE